MLIGSRRHAGTIGYEKAIDVMSLVTGVADRGRMPVACGSGGERTFGGGGKAERRRGAEGFQ
ncbi:MAG: hypothetical protein NVS1B4_02810 [Gemmatimonadaceae bacterium]